MIPANAAEIYDAVTGGLEPPAPVNENVHERNAYRAVGDVTVARGELDQALIRRDETIRAALAAGIPYTALAEWTGLSRGMLDAIRQGKRRRG